MTDKKQLGKREQVRALKEAARANIEALRVKIHTFDIYHVHSKPAGRMTVAQLEVVELRLKEIAVKLGIDSI